MSPRFSVIIPTLNEAERVAAAVAAARAALGADCEVVVSDGGSTDGTAAGARRAGAVVVGGAEGVAGAARVEGAEGRGRGRGFQLDEGVRAATGAVCVLVHADTLLPAGAGAAIERALQSAIGGAFRLQFAESELDWLAHAINLRSRLFGTATGDQAMFFLREELVGAGGVPRVELFEDVRLWRQMKRAGRLTLLEAKVTTSARFWIRVGTWRGIALHWRLRLLHTLGVPPHELARRYPSAGS